MTTNSTANCFKNLFQPLFAEGEFSSFSRWIGTVLSILGLIEHILYLFVLRFVKPSLSPHHIISVNFSVTFLCNFTIWTFLQVYAFIMGNDFLLTCKEPCLPSFSVMVIFILLMVAVATLAAIYINLYISIFKPLHYPTIVSKKRVYIAISLIWLITILLTFVPVIVTAIKVTSDKDSHFCVLLETELKIYGFGNISIVLIILLVAFIGNVFVLWKIGKIVHTNIHKYPSMKSKKKLLHTVAYLFGSIFFCYLPIVVALIYSLAESPVGPALHQAAVVLFILENLVIPLIFGGRLKDVRLAYKYVFYTYFKCRCRWVLPKEKEATLYSWPAHVTKHSRSAQGNGNGSVETTHL